MANKTEVLMVLGKMNTNNHIYVDNENLHKMIEEYNGRADSLGGFGELGYPDSFEISLSNVSHSVKNIRIEEDKVVGEVHVLSSPMGQKLKTMLESVVFRPRSTGRVLENGEIILDRIFSFDAVTKENDAFAGLI